LASRKSNGSGRPGALVQFLGVAVGEHLGYLFTGIWTALAGVALIESDLLVTA
jgi:hypothetical protein